MQEIRQRMPSFVHHDIAKSMPAHCKHWAAQRCAEIRMLHFWPGRIELQGSSVPQVLSAHELLFRRVQLILEGDALSSDLSHRQIPDTRTRESEGRLRTRVTFLARRVLSPLWKSLDTMRLNSTCAVPRKRTQASEESCLHALDQKGKPVITGKLLPVDEDFVRRDRAHMSWLQEPQRT